MGSSALVLPGKVPFTVYPRMEIRYKEIEVKEFDTEKTIWMFPFVGLSGVLQPAGTAATNSYQVNFSIEATSEVRYFRISEDPTAFGSDFSPGEDLNTIEQKDPDQASVDGVPSLVKATWLPISQLTAYQFPGFGGYRLYYQFADATKQKFSPVYNVVAILADLTTGGLVIGNGQPIQSRSKLPITVQLPVTAISMRFAEWTSFARGSWRMKSDTFEYDFLGVTPLVNHVSYFSSSVMHLEM